MNPDLMRSTGLQLGQEQIRTLPALQSLEPRASGPPVLDNSHLLAVMRRPADGRIDDLLVFTYVPHEATR
jgi:hypothetical protein